MIFGHIDGIKLGTQFLNRRELFNSGVHRQLQAGISGNSLEGANSIVLSGGYIDDKDYGNEIVYTGHGGRDETTGKQVSDQQLILGNKALVISFENSLPVRVTRGFKLSSEYAPDKGYRYDGLYKIQKYWSEKGEEGFLIWRFNLVALDDCAVIESFNKNTQTKRKMVISNRIVRNQDFARKIKELYDYKCQICGFRIETPVGYYAEAAHIIPLGEPHHGKDDLFNIVCLCPNHHKMLDYHQISINSDFTISGIPDRKLNVHEKHKIDIKLWE